MEQSPELNLIANTLINAALAALDGDEHARRFLETDGAVIAHSLGIASETSVIRWARNPISMADRSDWATCAQLAAESGIPASTISSWATHDHIDSVKLNGRRYVRRHSFKHYVRNRGGL